jgi:hypothetical protein
LFNKNGVSHQTRSDMLTKVTTVLPLASESSTHQECSEVTQQISLGIRENTMRVEQTNKRIMNFKLGAEILGRPDKDVINPI